MFPQHTRCGVITISSFLCIISISLPQAWPAAPSVHQAAEPRPTPSARLSLNDALALFLQQNLDVLIAKYGIEYSKGQQITARLFPNPVMSIGTLSSYTQGRTLSTGGQLFFQAQQLFELAGQRALHLKPGGNLLFVERLVDFFGRNAQGQQAFFRPAELSPGLHQFIFSLLQILQRKRLIRVQIFRQFVRPNSRPFRIGRCGGRSGASPASLT